MHPARHNQTDRRYAEARSLSAQCATCPIPAYGHLARTIAGAEITCQVWRKPGVLNAPGGGYVLSAAPENDRSITPR